MKKLKKHRAFFIVTAFFFTAATSSHLTAQTADIPAEKPAASANQTAPVTEAGKSGPPAAPEIKPSSNTLSSAAEPPAAPPVDAKSASGRLRSHTAGDTGILLSPAKTQLNNQIRFDGSKIIYRTFDSRMRVSRETVFASADTASLAKAVPQSASSFFYHEQGVFPFKKITEDYKTARITAEYFDADGRCIMRRLYEAVKSEKSGKAPVQTSASPSGIGQTDQKTPPPAGPAHTADSAPYAVHKAKPPAPAEIESSSVSVIGISLISSKLLEEYQIIFDFKGNLIEEKHTMPEVTLRSVYLYTENASVPDEYHYENEVLARTIQYETDKEYTQTVYFDDGISVSTLYINSIKREETYYVDGKKIRRRQFE